MGLGICDNVVITRTTAASSSTDNVNAAIFVPGGVACQQNVVIGTSLDVNGTATLQSATTITSTTDAPSVPVSPSSSAGSFKLYGGLGMTALRCGSLYSVLTTNSTSTTTGSVTVPGGLAAGQNFEASNLKTLDTTASSSTGTGALKTLGGASIAKNLNVGGTVRAQSLTTTGGLGLAGSMNIGGSFSDTSSTNASSTTTGAVVVAGGVGVNGRLTVGGSIVLAGAIGLSNGTYYSTALAENCNVYLFSSIDVADQYLITAQSDGYGIDGTPLLAAQAFYLYDPSHTSTFGPSAIIVKQQGCVLTANSTGVTIQNNADINIIIHWSIIKISSALF